MTFEEIFRSRLLLIGAQRHIAHKGTYIFFRCESGTGCAALQSSDREHRALKFDRPSDWDAYKIVDELIAELEREFQAKRKR